MANNDINQYELLDFGDGRKLERFGEFVVDRPSPSADGVPRAEHELWRGATARYQRSDGDQGVWKPPRALPPRWTATFALSLQSSAPLGESSNVAVTFQLQSSPFGHIGVFPEQRENWEWIATQVKRAGQRLGRAPRVLNLFAYTGASTLAAAAAGAEVVHIDAARNIVDRARENAALSRLANRPIRWIVEDAVKFCRREVKRGNQYDGVILDPPSYGHGPKGEPWKIAEHLLPLLESCGTLTGDARSFLVATCHTPGIGPAELVAYLADGIFGHCGERCAAGELYLQTAAGRRLPSGVYARWPG